MNGVGLLACFPRVNPNKLRSAASLRCLGTQTARQCFRFPPGLSDPAKCLVPHHLAGTLRPSPSARLSGSCLSAYLALHCDGFTGSNIKASSPAPPSSVPLQTLRAPTSRDWHRGTGAALPGTPGQGGKRRQSARWQSARTSSLRSSRGSNRRCTPVLADRARRQRGQSKTSRPRDFVRPAEYYGARRCLSPRIEQ